MNRILFALSALAVLWCCAACSDDSKDEDGLAVTITEPKDGKSFLTNALIDFECRAILAEGGAAPSANFRWEVEPGGITFYGASAQRQLAKGEYRVACIATDPTSGLDGDAEVTIKVGDAVVTITTPKDGARYSESSPGSGQSVPITFVADGNSLTGGGGTYSWDIGPVSEMMGHSVQTSLPIGEHEAVVKYTDSASNFAEDSVRIEVLTQEDWNACTANEEICNGIDDNCNGHVDEGHISCGVGACLRQVQRCENGEENVCVPGDPAPETCNGADDDCDGTVDEHGGDIDSLCTEADEVCANGHCVSYEQAAECTTCPCDECDVEQQGNRGEICCLFAGVGPTDVICVDAESGRDCPVL